MGDPLFNIYAAAIAELALKNRLLTVSAGRAFTDAGILLSYGPSYFDLHKRAATYVDKILKGAMPADLPVEQPTKFELVINLKTAKALGLEVPPTLLARADEVIEMTYCNHRASAPHRVASARREWSRGGAYENSIAANDRYLEPVADYRGRANGVRAGASHGTA